MGNVYDRGHKFSYLTCPIITIISKFKRQWITIDKGGSINSLEPLAIISRNFPPSMRFLKIKGNSRGGIFLISPKVISVTCVYGPTYPLPSSRNELLWTDRHCPLQFPELYPTSYPSLFSSPRSLWKSQEGIDAARFKMAQFQGNGTRP